MSGPSFILDALVFAEMYVSVFRFIIFTESLGFVPVDTFDFEDGEEMSTNLRKLILMAILL